MSGWVAEYASCWMCGAEFADVRPVEYRDEALDCPDCGYIMAVLEKEK